MLCLLFLPAQARPADWKSLADEAIGLSSAAVTGLEAKKDKTEQDVFMLTLIYYREYDHARLKNLFAQTGKKMQTSPAVQLLNSIILMCEHRHRESLALLDVTMKAHPAFYPAIIVQSHLNYLQKDFDVSYAQARRLISRKKELSRYHYTVSLLLAAGAKGILTKKTLIDAIPGYFEVKNYFKEARTLMPEAAEVLYGLGSFHLLAPPVAGGDVNLAISLLEQSRNLTPLNTRVYVRLAQAHRHKGNGEAYCKNIAQAEALDAQDELLVDYLSGEKSFLDVP